MTQPLAVLNDEEMHWLNDLGLPNQRRWLNHRNSVTNTAERFPPPPRIVAYLAAQRHIATKNFSHKNAQKSQKEFSIRVALLSSADPLIRIYFFVTFVPFCG